MTTQIKRRRGTTTEHNSFTGAEGEITIDTTKDTAVVHDGSTAGGHPLAKEDGSTLTNVDINSGSIDGVTIGGASAGAGTFTNLTATGTTTLAGATTSADITFGDNDKAIFGAGSDLQIYHDGSHSYVDEQGTGSLQIRATNLNLKSSTNETYIGCVADGQVEINYNNSLKLATTSTGIDVTGTAVTDGLTVSGNVSVDGGTIKLDGNYPVGTSNVALGDGALDALTSGSESVAVGTNALTTQTTGRNTALGFRAGQDVSTGTFNTLIGGEAGENTTTGSNNVAVGLQSLRQNTTASNNTAVGYQAGYSNTTGSADAFGYLAGYSNTTGSGNVYFGNRTGYSATTAIENTGIGYYPLYTNTGSYNSALGYAALYYNSTGQYNTALGTRALQANTTASNNTAVGSFALTDNTTGIDNVAMGRNAAFYTTTGIRNVAIGTSSLNDNITGSNNTVVGWQAHYQNETGDNNTVMGWQAMFNGNGSSQCTAIGREALEDTTGDYNTAVGFKSGQLITTGIKNTILGSYNGNQGGLDIRTSSNNIVLSDGDGNPRGYFLDSVTGGRWFLSADRSNDYVLTATNSTGSPYGIASGFSNAAPDNNVNQFFVGYDTTATRFVVWSDGDVANHDNSYGAISDVKLKEQITDASSQWDDIKSLNIRKYKMKSDVAEKGDSDEHWRLGVVAQEVEAAGMSGLVKTSPDMIENEDGEMVESGEYTKSVKYSILYMKAVKALQEAMDRIETLEAKVATLEGN